MLTCRTVVVVRLSFTYESVDSSLLSLLSFKLAADAGLQRLSSAVVYNIKSIEYTNTVIYSRNVICCSHANRRILCACCNTVCCPLVNRI